VRIVTLGDSITKGVRPGVKTEETFAALLQVRLRKEGIDCEVTNMGVGSERTDLALARLAKDVVPLKPRFVTIMYGTNDSYVDKGQKEPRLTEEEYRTNLKQLVADLRETDIQPVLMTEPRWGNGAGSDGVGEH